MSEMKSDSPFDGERIAAIRRMVVHEVSVTGRGRPTRRIAVVVSLVVAALLVSGGGTALALTGNFPFLMPPAPPVTDTPTPTPTETPTPTPTPAPSATSAAPVQIASDPSTWIIGYDQIGGVHVGEPVGALAQAAGIPSTADGIGCAPGYVRNPSLPAAGGVVGIELVQLEPGPNDRSDPVLDFASIMTAGTPDGVIESSPRTEAGIRLGSTEAELLAAYPDIQRWPTKYDSPGGLTTYLEGPPDGRHLVFAVNTSDNGARTVIIISSTTSQTLIDACD
jgi:hypothetical protein